jgi:site-specific DNA-methyltransferase (adenine-specific)
VKTFKNGSVELLHMDCMEYMRGLPDKAFNLAIVDPPYSWNSGNAFTSRLKRYGDLSFNDNRPSPEYFKELARVSMHQIIWGGNYFVSDLRDSKCWIVWDKHQPVKTYARLEMAWTSFGDRHAEYLDLPYFGATGRDISREHPNQKPIALYERILSRHAKLGDRVLDTHLGSGSSAIAAHYGGFEFVGMELDADYYAAAVKRFQQETAQQALNI